MKKFPYAVRVSEPGRRWLANSYQHSVVRKWLTEHYGERGEQWFCNDAGIYHFKDPIEALEFKLQWT